MNIRHVYDGKQDEVSQKSGLDFKNDRGLTKQSQKDDADINVITRRYEKTGVLPDLIRAEPRYGDFTDVPSYQASLHIVAHAEEQFAALDAHTRARFQNDPAKFLEFATNPASLDEMVKMGLATAKVENPTPSPAEPAPVAPGAPTNGGAK